MLPHQFPKAYSTTSRATSLCWRNNIKQAQLASQISTALLQRRNWVPLLQNLSLFPKLTPSLFLQILHKTQTNPQVSLEFFNWAKVNMRFEPDLKSNCQIIQLSLGSGLIRPVKPILDSLIQIHHVSEIVQSLIQACKGTVSQSSTLSFVLGCYSRKGLFREGLEVFRKMNGLGFVPSVVACNALLNAIQRGNEIKLAWCFYGLMIRNGVLPDGFTWSLIAQILCKDEKFEGIVRLLDLGICNSVMYNLLVDGYSKSGNFGAAFELLNDMCDRKLDPDFSTYSSILDGACKLGDGEVVERVMSLMVEKKLRPTPTSPLSKHDSIVEKLCDLGKTHAAEMFFKKACDEKIGLPNATYGRVLKALTNEVRTKEAIRVYRLISEKGIVVDDSSYHSFADLLCKEVRSEEGFELLMDVIRRGFSPCASELSQFLSFLCHKGRWKETEDLLNVVLDKGGLPDSICCSSLVGHYCSRRQVDSALALHHKIETLDGSLDVTTYNVLLSGLFAAKRIEEAMRVFDYMRRRDLMSSASFTIMIRGLCRDKELRKAMKIHDEMLKMGLKPDAATYKRLISGFQVTLPNIETRNEDDEAK